MKLGSGKMITFEKKKKEISREMWIEDIDYLWDTIIDTHPDPFTIYTKEELKNKLQDIKEKVTRENQFDVESGIREFVTEIGDMHTTTMCIDEVFRFPLELMNFKGEYRVISVDEKHSEILGYKLIGINGVEVEEVVSRIKNFIPKENELYRESMGMRFVTSPEALKIVNVALEDRKGIFEFKNNEGKSVEMIMEPSFSLTKRMEKYERQLAFPKARLVAPDFEAPYWYDYDEKKHVLYVKYRMCMDNIFAEKANMYHAEKYQNYFEFIQELYDFIENNKIEKFIFDLRGNQGGQVKYPKYLFLKFLESEKWEKYIDSKGKFYVLIDRWIHSAGTELCTYLRRNTNGVFIGEPTGANIKVFSVMLNKTNILPNSKIEFSCAHNDNDEDGFNENFKPDIDIKVSFEQIKNGVDPLMEFALGEK